MNDLSHHIGLADYAEVNLPKRKGPRPAKGDLVSLRGGDVGGGYVEGPWIISEDSVDFGDTWFVRLRRP